MRIHYELRIFRKKIVFNIEEGIYLQDVVNDFLAEKGEKIIAVHPIMEKTLLVHYTE